jgi:glycosyltransferase involved in cell wall biosynthesis
MKITVSVFGRYHAFDLAQQLYKRGYLSKLITSYPKFLTREYEIPDYKVKSIFLCEITRRGWSTCAQVTKTKYNPQFLLHEFFDRSANSHIPIDTDIFIGWSSFSERGFIKAKQNGATVVVERGSAHIEYQRDILEEEYLMHNAQADLPDQRIVEKEKREYELADYICLPSRFAKSTFLEKKFLDSKLITIPYGVNLENFYLTTRPDDKFRIIYVGAMTLQKGVHYLLRAFTELNLPNAELWLVGAKTLEIEPFFAKYSDHFVYFGHVRQAELPSYYAKCSLFTICSVQDGLAMVQMQAMACGLPVICTSNVGGEELITNGQEGFVIPIRDLDSLKNRIIFFYENRDACIEMGIAARNRVAEGFSWDTYGDRIAETYENIYRSKYANQNSN